MQSANVITSISVLIIEDDELLAEFVQDMLEDEGFIVHVALDGAAGIDAAVLRRPTVILLDVSMPKLNGFQVLEWLKTDLRTRHIPVIMLTSHSQLREIEGAIAAGAKGYLVKPVSGDALIKRIMTVLKLVKT
ncbi:MAG: response regulator [Rhodospirillaceae bacterium]